MVAEAILAIALLGGLVDIVSEHQATLPEEERLTTYYLDLRPAEGNERLDLERAIKLMVSSASRQSVIEHSVPVRLGPHPLLVFNTARLGWDHKQWLHVLKDYPYSATPNPAMIRADWLLVTLADNHESDAYRRLLFGVDEEGKLISKRDELLKLLNVAEIEQLTWGAIESQSGVSKQGVRLITSLPVPRGYAYGTRDVLTLNAKTDPLENLDRQFAHDGEEWIIGWPTVSLATGQRGAKQFYFLSDGQGNIVNRAPVDLVEDSTTFRGYREIRCCGSCIQCHDIGLNQPTRNDVRDFLASGAEIFAKEKNVLGLDRFYGSDLRDEFTRHNELYARYIFAALNLQPEENISEGARAFRRAVDRYDNDLDLVSTAIELRKDPAGWRAALGASGVEIGARLAGLGGGRTISRDAWEALTGDPPVSQYLRALELANRLEVEEAAEPAQTIEPTETPTEDQEDAKSIDLADLGLAREQ